MTYFRKLPDLLYPTLRNDRSSSLDYTKIKNLFKRAKLRDDFLNIFTAFEKYSVIGDDRPDAVANLFYKDSGFDWLILIVNNIQNVRTEWPMPQRDFNNFINEKYTPQQLSQIHHYETSELRNSFGELIMPRGLIVDSNFTFKYMDDGIQKTYSSLVSVSNFDYENVINEDKRDIIILKSEYTRIVEKDLKKLFTYDTSSEFINQRTIKTYNPRTFG